MRFPMYTKRISTDEVAENSEPEIKKQDKRLILSEESTVCSSRKAPCNRHEGSTKKRGVSRGVWGVHGYGFFLERNTEPKF